MNESEKKAFAVFIIERESKRTQETFYCDTEQEAIDTYNSLVTSGISRKYYISYGKWDGLMYVTQKSNYFKESIQETKNSIYNPKTILKAYEIEQRWLKQMENTVDGVTQVLLFIINDYEQIIDTHAIAKSEIKTYKPAENEYHLYMMRDSGNVLIDYILEPAQHLVDLWNDPWNIPTKKTEQESNIKTHWYILLDNGVKEHYIVKDYAEERFLANKDRVLEYYQEVVNTETGEVICKRDLLAEANSEAGKSILEKILEIVKAQERIYRAEYLSSSKGYFKFLLYTDANDNGMFLAEDLEDALFGIASAIVVTRADENSQGLFILECKECTKPLSIDVDTDL